MKKEGKIKTIIRAFTGDLPVDEQWYKDRLAICAVCPMNTAVEKPDSFLMSLLKKVDGNKPQCKACGCYIAQKAAMKEEECGLASLGQKPKWPSLMIRTDNSYPFLIYNNSPEVANLGLNTTNEHFVLEYLNKLNNGDNSTINFVIETKEPVSAFTVSVGCSCTKATHKVLSNTMVSIDASLDISALFDKQAFAKSIYVKVEYFRTVGGKSATDTARIMLKGFRQS